MTARSPEAPVLLRAVSAFLQSLIREEAAGGRDWEARIARNCVELVCRELALRPVHEPAQRQRLQTLLGSSETDLSTLDAQLCKALHAGEIHWSNPELSAHLRATTIEQLRIDNPRYLRLSGVTAPHEASGDSGKEAS
ncbi:MAG: hypothetical protein JJU27_00805 [Gammaproteobacteria bacterium]|nr:hypothetical protein [Gammaproteobacteria bacterium]